jgi:glycine reductase
MFSRGELQINNITFGEQTSINNKRLTIEKRALQEFLLAKENRITKVNISLAKPGDSTRILCVKDVIQPWHKVSGAQAGRGTRLVLDNVAVVTCGKIVGFQEGIIDMQGPGVPYSPFSQTMNVVLEIDVIDGLTPYQHEECVRNTGLRAAAFLGKSAREIRPDRMEEFSRPEDQSTNSSLPRIAYIYPLLTQGLLHDSYLLGKNAKTQLPRKIAPQLLFDGALCSGNCVSACDKNTTWHHQNNPILFELLDRHDRDLSFVGVVLASEPVRLADKEKSARKVVKLLEEMDVDGAILSKEGFGNPDADQMMLIRGCERQGIKTVALTDEFAGADGWSQSTADSCKEADAVISVGNANEKILLPPMKTLLGPIKDLSQLTGAYPQSLQEDGSLEIELQGIIGATNELGNQKLSCREV